MAVEPAAKRMKPYQHTREAFLEVYSGLRDQLVNDPLIEDQPPEALEWVKEMLDYNVPGGKLNRGMAVFDTVRSIKGESVTEDDIFQANTLGWCIELLQAFFLVADDIMDGSITRRGQPCWYKQPKVGMIACNDYILLECCIYRLLQRHFRQHPKYTELVDLFHQVTYQTSRGQLYDLLAAPQGPVDLSKFTMETYLRVVTYKTAFYTIYLPVACGLLLTGKDTPEILSLTNKICIELGRFFQIQDDYLDCFAPPEVLGKIGTDIQDAKCSWLVCIALQHANDAQRNTLKAHYGKHEPEHIAAVKAVYEELKLKVAYEQYENKSYEELTALIHEQQLLPKEVFTTILAKIYKRKK